MKAFIVITDVNHKQHVAEINVPDGLSFEEIQKTVFTQFHIDKFIKVQDGLFLNVNHILNFKVKE